MAGGRAKRSEIWDLGVVVACIWGTFDLLGLRSFWGHTVHLSIWPVTQKTDGCSEKRFIEFGASYKFRE